jgi:hypothetical protein
MLLGRRKKVMHTEMWRGNLLENNHLQEREGDRRENIKKCLVEKRYEDLDLRKIKNEDRVQWWICY